MENDQAKYLKSPQNYPQITTINTPKCIEYYPSRSCNDSTVLFPQCFRDKKLNLISFLTIGELFKSLLRNDKCCFPEITRSFSPDLKKTSETKGPLSFIPYSLMSIRSACIRSILTGVATDWSWKRQIKKYP